MPPEITAWDGLIAGRADPSDPIVIELPIKPSPRGGSGTFLAADGDGTQWWVKPLNNVQGERVTVTEAIVGLVGALIGAPTCDTAIVWLPPEIEGWEFRPGRIIESGFAHASLAIPGVQEANSLLYREQDENVKRHAGVFALYDWCWGGDDQWLYAEPEDRQLYSHDHGWYFPETGPNWSITTLAAHVDEPHEPTWATEGLDKPEISRLAMALRELEREALLQALSNIPFSWPVTDAELEACGWFLERRATPAADRLDALGGAL